MSDKNPIYTMNGEFFVESMDDTYIVNMNDFIYAYTPFIEGAKWYYYGTVQITSDVREHITDEIEVQTDLHDAPVNAFDQLADSIIDIISEQYDDPWAHKATITDKLSEMAY